jgi:hypothetical protein
MECINATSLRRKSGQWGTQPLFPVNGGHPSLNLLWQVEKEMTLQRSPWMLGPEGRSSKLQPSPEGLGINSEDDLSAVGAALNLACPCVRCATMPSTTLGQLWFRHEDAHRCLRSAQSTCRRATPGQRGDSGKPTPPA